MFTRVCGRGLKVLYKGGRYTLGGRRNKENHYSPELFSLRNFHFCVSQSERVVSPTEADVSIWNNSLPIITVMPFVSVHPASYRHPFH